MKSRICFFFLISTLLINAQTVLKTNYNGKLNLGQVENGIKISLLGNNSTKTFRGNEINDFVFEKPGKYHVLTEEMIQHKKGECEHNHLPKEFDIEVSPYSILFNRNSIKFSSPIRKNVETNGILLSISVDVKSFDHSPIKMNQNIVNCEGIGSKITAELVNSYYQLGEGVHTITYVLKGVVSENSYLMFDFLEPNGNIQSVALTFPVEN